MNPSDDQPQLPAVQQNDDDDESTLDDAAVSSATPQQTNTDKSENYTQPQHSPPQISSSPQFTQNQNDLSVPQNAEDIDLIEKEWVDKAKEIVDSTIGDPHKQTEKINKMKAEYIRKRYGKNIKT